LLPTAANRWILYDQLVRRLNRPSCEFTGCFLIRFHQTAAIHFMKYNNRKNSSRVTAQRLMQPSATATELRAPAICRLWNRGAGEGWRRWSLRTSYRLTELLIRDSALWNVSKTLRIKNIKHYISNAIWDHFTRDRRPQRGPSDL